MRYQVTIEAVIRKTIEVEAQDEEEAREEAHGLFTVECDGDEHYTQEVLEINEVDDEREQVSDEARSYGPHFKN